MIFRAFVPIVFVACASASIASSPAQQPAQAAASASDAVIAGLRALRVDAKPNAADGHGAQGEPDALAKAIAGKPRVIVFGRCGYGAPEVAREEALVTQLACSSGVTLVVIDVGFEEGLSLEAYVQGGAGDARAVCASIGAWGAGAVPAELLDTMRARNRDEKMPRVHVVG